MLSVKSIKTKDNIRKHAIVENRTKDLEGNEQAVP